MVSSKARNRRAYGLSEVNHGMESAEIRPPMREMEKSASRRHYSLEGTKDRSQHRKLGRATDLYLRTDSDTCCRGCRVDCHLFLRTASLHPNQALLKSVPSQSHPCTPLSTAPALGLTTTTAFARPRHHTTPLTHEQHTIRERAAIHIIANSARLHFT